ncbi:hypothetical protein KA111_02240 [Candidatus Woesebacteria bacterium]|nr:hypothetical protein [Candidatus Woesebacteria bacterium]
MKLKLLKFIPIIAVLFVTLALFRVDNVLAQEAAGGVKPAPANITTELTAETFDALNPLVISGSPNAAELSTPGGIVTRALNFLFPLAGLILFLLISWGGFEMLISSSDSKGIEAGKNRVTAAIVGFILLFCSYWLAQIVELVFGIIIL